MSEPFVKVRVSDDLARELRHQRKKFIKKFGREPGPNDPVLFDENNPAPTPQPMTDESINAALVPAMKDAGMPAHLIYAFKKTGLILTQETYRSAPANTRAEWDAAVAEYFAKNPKTST